MNITKTPFSLLAAAVLALCTACAADWTAGDTLAEPQPLVFTATQGALTGGITRAAADGTWEGGEQVAIQIDGVVKKYIVDESGALTPDGNTTPFYRTSTSDIDYTAWYPYSTSLPTVSTIIVTDQSTEEAQESCNLMTASGKAVNGNTTTIQFSHKAARIRLHVYKEGSTSVGLTGATVRLSIGGQNYTAHEDGDGYYSVLVAPGTSVTSGASFVSISISAGATYAGTAPADATFSAGTSYDYNFDLKRSLVSTTQTVNVTWPTSLPTSASQVTVKYGSTTLTVGTDYELTTSTEGYIGTATITGKGLYTGSIQKEYETTTIPYLTFKASSEQGFKMTLPTSSTFTGKFQYSVGGGAWTDVTSGAAVTFGGTNNDLRLRGVSPEGTNTEYTSSSNKISFTNEEVSVAASGDIRTLVDYKNYDTAETKDARFSYLFDGSKSLTSAPVLPATTLASSCYQEMFYGCIALGTPPELPATTLATSCYAGMFYGCTGLTSAPALPAETLASHCYYGMFNGCTGLTSAPTLPAKTLAPSCYYTMFCKCTALTSAPELPATTLAKYCYREMFSGCTKITSAPQLSVMTLAEGCYYSMFSGCTALTSAPTLSATTLAKDCYYGMFRNCTSLQTAPKLQAMTLAGSCYHRMFSGCISLLTAPDLPATTLETYCYCEMFCGCTSLTVAPELPATELKASCYYQMFYGCSNLKKVTIKAEGEIPSMALYNWLKGVASSGTIYYNKTSFSNIIGIPSGWTKKDLND